MRFFAPLVLCNSKKIRCLKDDLWLLDTQSWAFIWSVTQGTQYQALRYYSLLVCFDEGQQGKFFTLGLTCVLIDALVDFDLKLP